MCFTLAYIDEGFVTHDFFTLVELTFELGSNFLFLPCSEFIETLFHINFKFE